MRWCNPDFCRSLPNVACTASSPISLTPVCVCQVKGSTLKVEGQPSSLDARLHQLQSMMHQDVKQLSDTITKVQMAASNRIRCVHPNSSTCTEQCAASEKLGADGVGRRARSKAEGGRGTVLLSAGVVQELKSASSCAICQPAVLSPVQTAALCLSEHVLGTH